ncbi:MAG: AIR synthase related protein [Candidatus Altiarchaeota archaeon]
MKEEINRALEHMMETNSIRKVFWHMDEKVDRLRFGIRQGDDAVVVDKMVVNMEGPYPLKIGRKAGLVHTCSDIVIMGAKPLFALNSMQVDSIREAKEVSEDVKKQSNGLDVPVIGGNTQMENDLKPCISFTVFGRLQGKPIPDAGCEADDRILMLGDIVEGSIGERVYRATTKFNTYLEILEKKIIVNASKDASRGGWFGNLAEMLVKSKKGVKITSIPYPRFTRYMGTYLISVPANDVDNIISIASKNKCPVVEIGTILKEPKMLIGRKVVVSKQRMQQMIRQFPFRTGKI